MRPSLAGMKALWTMLVAGALLIAPAAAGHDDPRLDELFAALAQASSPHMAEPIEAEIWAIWSQTPSPTSALLLDRSTTIAEAGDLDAAMKLLNALVALDPGFAEAWNTRANLKVMRDDYAAALKDIERTLALEPRHFAALAGLGQILLSSGDETAALKAFDAALKINPTLTEVKTQADRLRRKVDGEPI